MISPATIGRFLIAMLLAAQLSGTLHAAEHGHGDHDHDGVACLFVAVTNDDADALLPSDIVPQFFRNDSDDPPISLGVIDASSNLRVPPATGPPAIA